MTSRGVPFLCMCPPRRLRAAASGFSAALAGIPRRSSAEPPRCAADRIARRMRAGPT